MVSHLVDPELTALQTNVNNDDQLVPIWAIPIGYLYLNKEFLYIYYKFNDTLITTCS